MATKVHNVLFYKPKPETIQCMALNNSKTKLAVSRSDCRIEIWNVKDLPYIERTIPTIIENSSIEDLTWFGDRLLSVGLHGFLVEYDLRALTRKKFISVTGEQAYCLDVDYNRNCVAIGTEMGYINIFSIEEEDIKFNTFMDKQEGRIMCLKYDKSGNFIVTGGMDAIRIWDVKTKQAIHRLTTGRTEKKKSTIVWCLHVFSDLIIATGDSRGKLTFWDGKIGAQIQSYQSHKNDIIALCVSDDEMSLFCAGVDPTINNFARVNVKGENKWVRNLQRRVHDHDVKSLILSGKKLYSGGADGHLGCTYYPPKTLIKYAPLLNNCAQVCLKAKCILLNYGQHLEVWSLGSQANTPDNGKTTEMLCLQDEPKKLLLLQRTHKNESGIEIKEGIICTCMSDDGKWIAFSTDTTTKLWRVNFKKDEQADIQLIQTLPLAVQMHITPNTSKLILALRTGNLEIYNLNNDAVSLHQTIKIKTMLEDIVSFLITSPCEQYLLAADPQSNVIIWKQTNNQFIKSGKLPRYSSAPVAMTFKPNSKSVVCVYADHKVVEFDVKDNCLTPLSNSNFSNALKNGNSIRGIIFEPEIGNAMLLHDDTNLFVINPIKGSATHTSKKARNSISNGEIQHINSKVINKYRHISYMKWLSSDELVIVQVDPISILLQLPPCLQQKKFGTK